MYYSYNFFFLQTKIFQLWMKLKKKLFQLLMKLAILIDWKTIMVYIHIDM